MTSLTVENYAKAIYVLCSAQQDRPAATGQIAEALQVSPGTVTSMLKTLRDSGLATYKPYEGVSLTPHGARLALRILRRHRLIELFLARTLELSWDEVHEEAEHMEHAMSDRLIDRIDAYLGYPEVDPHGDPIPQGDGSWRTRDDGQPLPTLEVGQEFRLVRVLDQSPEFLRYLRESGLELGSEGRLQALSLPAGAATIEIDGRSLIVGLAAAEQMLVRRADREDLARSR